MDWAGAMGGSFCQSSKMSLLDLGGLVGPLLLGIWGGHGRLSARMPERTWHPGGQWTCVLWAMPPPSPKGLPPLSWRRCEIAEPGAKANFQISGTANATLSCHDPPMPVLSAHSCLTGALCQRKHHVLRVHIPQGGESSPPIIIPFPLLHAARPPVSTV